MDVSDKGTARPYRMVKRAEQAAATRERVLDAAAELLRTGALDAASIDDVAVRAGTTRATIYRAFGSKSTVLQALTWHVLGRVRLDRIDAAHAEPDVVDAVRRVLDENCRMFQELGELLPSTLALARREPEVADIIAATYHGRRHQAMERLATRVVAEGRAAPGWSAAAIADALLVLTSHETFETLTGHRRRSRAATSARLFDMASAFLA